MVNASYEEKQANFIKALRREEIDWIPNMVSGSCATIAWTGQKAVDVMGDPDAYGKAMTDVFSVCWTDASTFMNTLFTDRREKAWDECQNKFGPDGVTPEHIQQSAMLEEEYDQLIENPDEFARNVIVPRMHPRLFTDREYAKNALKVFAEDSAYVNMKLNKSVVEYMKKYGVSMACSFAVRLENPIDALFDYFRGYKGTILDIRRQPDKVHAVIDKFWEIRNLPAYKNAKPTEFPMAFQTPHITTYLSPKQFAEFYWPCQKKMMDFVASGNGKAYCMMEGRWSQFWEPFKDVKKDTVFLHVDDDDIFQAKKELGDYQLLCGGLKMSQTRMGTIDDMKDDIRKVIDECGAGGGFFYGADKAWIAPGDVNDVAIAAMNFAHEYSSRK